MAARLDTEVHGRGARLGLVHGFTQNRRCWGGFADRLAEHFEIVLVDAPGHGGSAAVIADLTTGAALIGDAVGRASYIGYSMGGRHTLRLALDRPDLVERLVLIGASPGLADAGERERRRVADEKLAERLETIGVAAFLDEWLAQPIFAGLATDTQFRDERQTNTVAGLAASLRLAGTGAQGSLWDRLKDLTVPTLLIVGEDDRKFAAVAQRMQEGIGARADIIVVRAAGHAPQLEQPGETAGVITEWLADQS